MSLGTALWDAMSPAPSKSSKKPEGKVQVDKGSTVDTVRSQESKTKEAIEEQTK